MKKLFAAIVTLAGAGLIGPAVAETIVVHDGGQVSVYLAPAEGDQHSLRGIISFENKPGWKSYWRDPGSSGIPPQINLMINGQPTDVNLHYPVPKWIDDDYGGFIGYVGPTSVPFDVETKTAVGAGTLIDISLFAGVCREVCIPVAGQATALVPLGSDVMTTSEQRLVNMGFASLPPAVHPDVKKVTAAHDKDGSVIVTVIGAVPQTSFAVGKYDGHVAQSFGKPTVLTSVEGETRIRFEPRGAHVAGATYDLHFVAALPPTGLQVTIAAENIE